MKQKHTFPGEPGLLNTSTIQGGTPSSQLTKLFENGLKDMYWAEKALTRAIPKMIRNASSDALVDALEYHLEETREQVSRAEQVFETIGKKAIGKKCEAMEGLIKEGSEIMAECEAGAMCDAGIIAASQKIEHYEIASYGTLRQFAETLGFNDAVDLLATTLKEEKNADGKLFHLAVRVINVQVAQPGFF
ncbi:MAG: ferritin-like domain-containing protein [Saprospiraceae bacterium]|nr:ferritin-like domain-containing protein [Saprospiraceae bacterium]